jgi:hypothetical protein
VDQICHTQQEGQKAAIYRTPLGALSPPRSPRDDFLKVFLLAIAYLVGCLAAEDVVAEKLNRPHQGGPLAPFRPGTHHQKRSARGQHT